MKYLLIVVLLFMPTAFIKAEQKNEYVLQVLEPTGWKIATPIIMAFRGTTSKYQFSSLGYR